MRNHTSISTSTSTSQSTTHYIPTHSSSSSPSPTWGIEVLEQPARALTQLGRPRIRRLERDGPRGLHLLLPNVQ